MSASEVARERGERFAGVAPRLSVPRQLAQAPDSFQHPWWCLARHARQTTQSVAAGLTSSWQKGQRTGLTAARTSSRGATSTGGSGGTNGLSLDISCDLSRDRSDTVRASSFAGRSARRVR